jgi:carbon monoxide dehydrogenase subunit G
MLIIKTNKKQIEASQAAVFAFLSDVSNIQQLMPEQVVNWKSDGDACSFTIKGMADIGMEITERIANSAVKMTSHGKVPFPFTLNVFIDESSAESSEAVINFEGDMNAFLKMMAEKPLTNFCNLLLEGLAKYFKKL